MTDGLQYSSRKVPRAARPDGTRDDRSFIVKNASHLRLTYQLFVLTMQAQTEGTGLVIVVPSPPRIDLIVTILDTVRAKATVA